MARKIDRHLLCIAKHNSHWQLLLGTPYIKLGIPYAESAGDVAARYTKLGIRNAQYGAAAVHLPVSVMERSTCYGSLPMVCNYRSLKQLR